MYPSRLSRLLLAAAAATLALAGCGGDDDANEDAEPEPSTTAPATTIAATTTSTTPVVVPETMPAGDVPDNDYRLGKRVCLEGRGFADNAAFDPAKPGPHPIMLFNTLADGYFEPLLEFELPDWVLESYDPYLEDTVAPTAELVGCIVEVGRTPQGVECTFEHSATDAPPLPLFDGAYELTVRVARTGEVLDTISLSGTSDGCPTGDIYRFPYPDEYVNLASNDAVVAALTPWVGV